MEAVKFILTHGSVNLPSLLPSLRDLAKRKEYRVKENEKKKPFDPQVWTRDLLLFSAIAAVVGESLLRIGLERELSCISSVDCHPNATISPRSLFHHQTWLTTVPRFYSCLIVSRSSYKDVGTELETADAFFITLVVYLRSSWLLVARKLNVVGIFSNWIP